VTLADRSMGLGLRALNRLAGLDLLDRMGLREPAQRLLQGASRNGFRAATTAGRAFTAVQRRDASGPTRLGQPVDTGLFDVTPTDEQQMLVGAFRDFAANRLRPAALDADTAAATSPELLAQGVELGLTTLGVPEELGGAVSERSVTSAWPSRRLRRPRSARRWAHGATPTSRPPTSLRSSATNRRLPPWRCSSGARSSTPSA